MRRAGLGVAAVALLGLVSCESTDGKAAADPAPTETTEQAESGPAMSGNAGCLVCHMTFLREPLSVRHLEEGITCARCHGPSIAHANDEDIGATPPDVIFKKDKVNPFCRTCHKVPERHPEKVVEGKVVRKRAEPGSLCTDCHGKHRIAQQKVTLVPVQRRSDG